MLAVDEFQGRKGRFNMFLKRPQWEFAPHGQCGTEVSTLFPFVAEHVDDIAMIRSMHTSHSNHYNATLGMHTGSFAFSRPSIGSWVSYGLGTFNSNLPSFGVASTSAIAGAILLHFLPTILVAWCPFHSAHLIRSYRQPINQTVVVA